MTTNVDRVFQATYATKAALREHLVYHHGLRGRRWYARAEQLHAVRHAGPPYAPDHRHEETP